MIDHKTPARIQELGDQIAAAALELEQIYRDLSTEADAKMAVAAQAFLTAHADRQPLHATYRAAHDGLLHASIAASNIRETAERAVTLRSRSTPWGGQQSRQHIKDLTLVCGQDPATVNLQAHESHDSSRRS